MNVNFMLTFLSILCYNITNCSRELSLSPLSDEEYAILLNKLLGRFDTAVTDRSTLEKAVLRKFYRWIKAGRELTVGSSGTNIYVDGKKLLRKSDVKRIIKRMEKSTKQSGRKILDYEF